MVNLKEIRQELSDERIIEILKDIGCDDYRDTSEALVFKTACHNVNPEDGSYKLYYYKNTKTFHCYTQCGCSFDIFELLRKRYDLLGIEYNFFKDIVLKISGNIKFDIDNEFYQAYESDFSKYSQNKPEVNLEVIDPKILNIYTHFYTPEWITDGISIEAMKTFNILYSIQQNKIIIPHYDINNNLIGIRGRALNPEDLEIGKYMPVAIGDKVYKHPLGYNLYGLNLNKDNIRKRKMAFIFESEKAVLQYETMFGRENNIAVAACGSSITAYQFDLLRKLEVEKIIIAFDKEGSTWTEREKYHEKLKKLCKKNSQYCLMGYMYDKPKLLDLKDSPTDKGKEVFKKIYKEGVVWT